MDIFVPDYYKNFKCIADKCKHTCCRGWEIDIDEESYARYMQKTGKMGARLRENIYTDEEGAHFRLSEDERCPFLNEQNLCDLILEDGEEALCQICGDHPRYRNFFESRTEVGLGLSCESAARLILEGETRPQMVAFESAETEIPGWEAEFFAFRESVIDMMFIEKPLETCMDEISLRHGITVPPPCFDFLNSLNVLNADWHQTLCTLKNPPQKTAEADMAARRLFAYFVFRHLADLYFDGREEAGIGFCLYAVKTVMQLSAGTADFQETARRFSEEIEYDTENVERIINMLGI